MTRVTTAHRLNSPLISSQMAAGEAGGPYRISASERAGQ